MPFAFTAMNIGHYMAQTRLDRFRDRVAQVGCNLLMRYVATEWYSTRIGNYIEAGIKAANPDYVPKYYETKKDFNDRPRRPE